MLDNYKGTIEVNGQDVNRLDLSNIQGSVCIRLTPQGFRKENRERKSVDTNDNAEYRITVRAYMTKKATEEFDFMAKMNNDIPMPLRTMVGRKIKETKGMEYWELHGQAEQVITCMRCGKELTNPISRKYGIGPECIRKVGITVAEDDVIGVTEQLINVKWSGWIIRSAIINVEEM